MTLTYALRVVRLTVSRPREAIERIRNRFEATDKSSLTPTEDWRAELDALLGGVESEWEKEFLTVLNELPAMGDHRHDADPELARAVYIAVRSSRPERVVETGVARGITSRVILEAMERNGCGHLWSIDLPPQLDQYADQWAAVVSDRRRWTFICGSSRQVLPRLVQDLGSIDLFLQDSAARNMRYEFELVWGAVRTGGLVIANNVGESNAFEAFCGVGSYVIGELSAKRGLLFGIAVK